jgi:hypothetical protein
MGWGRHIIHGRQAVYYWITKDRDEWSEYWESPEGQRIRQTPAYIEYAMPAGHPGMFLVTYWIALSPTSFLVANCWEHEFDFALHMMLDEKVGAGVVKSATETWPTFMALLTNVLQDNPRFSEGVLVRMNDPDDGESKWILGTYLGNFELKDPQDLFSDRSLSMANKVVQLSGAVGSEMSATPLETLPNLFINIYDEARKQELENAKRFVANYSQRLIYDNLSSALGRFLTG